MVGAVPRTETRSYPTDACTTTYLIRVGTLTKSYTNGGGSCLCAHRPAANLTRCTSFNLSFEPRNTPLLTGCLRSQHITATFTLDPAPDESRGSPNARARLGGCPHPLTPSRRSRPMLATALRLDVVHSSFIDSYKWTSFSADLLVSLTIVGE